MLYSSEEDVELTEADVKVGRVSQRSVGDLHPHGEAHGVGAHAVDSDVGQTDPCALQQCLERDIIPRQTDSANGGPGLIACDMNSQQPARR